MSVEQNHPTDLSFDQKLTSWAKEPDLLTLKHDLEQAKPTRDAAVLDINRWKSIIEVSGKEAPKDIPNRSKLQPRVVRRQNEWRYSALSEPFLGSDKLIEVTPRSFEDVRAAYQNEALLNFQFDTAIDKVAFIDEYVRTTTDEGTCIIRTGWERVTKTVKKMAPQFALYPPMPEQMELAEQALQMADSDPNTFFRDAPLEVQEMVKLYKESGELMVHQQIGEAEVEVEEVILNRPTVEFVNPANLYIDPACGSNPDKAKFMIYSFETSKAELEMSQVEYKNLERINWSSQTPIDNTEHAPTTMDANAQFKDKARQRIVAYEYWGYYDIEGNGHLEPIVATWIGNVLIRMDKNPYAHNKPPFIFVRYLPKKRSVYGEADAEFLGENQKFQGAIVRGVSDLLGRSANGQQGFAKGMLDPINRKRLERGDDYEFNPQLGPLQGNYIEHKYPEVPMTAINMLTMMNNEAEAMTGVKSFSGGMSGEGLGKVAAGIRGMLDAASKREMAILRRLANGIVQIAQHWMVMNGEFLSEEEVIRITNDKFITIRRDELNGHFDLKTDISTAEVDETKAQELAFLLQTLGPVAELPILKILLEKIARLRRMPDLAQMIREYEPQPDPVAEKVKELEIAKLDAEVARLRAQTAKDNAQAELYAAQTGQAELDFVEQADGTAHEREMEKTAVQPEAQARAQITKAMTTPVKEGENRPPIDAAIGFNALTSRQPLSSTPPVDINPALGAEPPVDPIENIGSMYFDPTQDPATNPAVNF